jgi:hypothetical protein
MRTQSRRRVGVRPGGAARPSCLCWPGKALFWRHAGDLSSGQLGEQGGENAAEQTSTPRCSRQAEGEAHAGESCRVASARSCCNGMGINGAQQAEKTSARSCFLRRSKEVRIITKDASRTVGPITAPPGEIRSEIRRCDWLTLVEPRASTYLYRCWPNVKTPRENQARVVSKSCSLRLFVCAEPELEQLRVRLSS